MRSSKGGSDVEKDKVLNDTPNIVHTRCNKSNMNEHPKNDDLDLEESEDLENFTLRLEDSDKELSTLSGHESHVSEIINSMVPSVLDPENNVHSVALDTDNDLANINAIPKNNSSCSTTSVTDKEGNGVTPEESKALTTNCLTLVTDTTQAHLKHNIENHSHGTVHKEEDAIHRTKKVKRVYILKQASFL